MKDLTLSRYGTSLLVLCGLLTLPVMMVFACTVGDLPVSFVATAQALANGIGLTHYPLPPLEEGVIWQYRMSRTLMAACSGGGLAVCGLVLQSLLRNALAEPYLLGISAGASTGAVCIMLLGLGGGVLSVSGVAFLGACASFGVIMILAGGGMRDGTYRIILAGVAGTQLFNALTAYVVTTSANAEQSRSVMFWLLGSLSGIRWPDALMSLGVISVGLIIIMYHARSLDTFIFGEEVSATLGTPILLVRIILFLTTALITAAIVSSIGAVGFVGLVIPHVIKIFLGVRHLVSIPATFLAGCHFMILADVVSRTLIKSQVLPIGVETALVGAPAFACILYKSRGKSFRI